MWKVWWELVGMSAISKWCYTDKDRTDHLAQVNLYVVKSAIFSVMAELVSEHNVIFFKMKLNYTQEHLG